MNQLRHRLHQVFLVSLAVCVGACSSTQPLTNGEKLQDNSTEIRVSLLDHRTIKFRAGEYRINPTVDSLYIEGVGTTEMTTEKAVGEFRGRIGLGEIRTLEKIHPKSVPPEITTLVIAGVVFIGAYFVAQALKSEPQDVAGAAEALYTR